jgi:hypothetical protein
MTITHFLQWLGREAWHELDLSWEKFSNQIKAPLKCNFEHRCTPWCCQMPHNHYWRSSCNFSTYFLFLRESGWPRRCLLYLHYPFKNVECGGFIVQFFVQGSILPFPKQAYMKLYEHCAHGELTHKIVHLKPWCFGSREIHDSPTSHNSQSVTTPKASRLPKHHGFK